MEHEIRSGTDAVDVSDTSRREVVLWSLRQTRRVRAGLLYSSAYLSVIAMAEVAIAMALLSLPLSIAPLICGLVTFAVYASDRVADLESDEVSSPRRTAFVRRHQGVLEVGAALTYGLAVGLSALGGPVALAITLAPGVFWILYAIDWIPDVTVGVRRLKDVLVVNTAVVALAWAVTLTFLPVAFVAAPVTPATVIVFAYFFLRSFVDVELPNVGDIAGDRAADVSTLPVVFGVTRTRQALYAVDILTMGLLVWAALASHLRVALVVPLLAGICYSLGVTYFVGRTDNVDGLSVAAECEYLVVALALLPVLLAS